MFGRNRSSIEDEAPPFWRQRGWLLSATFLVVVVVMSAVTWLRTDGQPAAGAQSSAHQGPLSVAAPRGGDGRPDGCHTDDSDSAIPTAAPDHIVWRAFPYGKVPVSLSAGPLRSDGALLWCFAHTPLGAVLAAHIIPTQTSNTDWRTVIDQQVVAGTPRDLFVALRSNASDQTDGGASVGLYIGFAVPSYSAEAATVRLLMSRAGAYQTTYFTTTVAVKWTGGDWKVQPARSGDLYTPVNSVSGNAGFVMWRV